MPENAFFNEALEEARNDPPDFDRIFQLLVQAQEEGDPRAAYTLGAWHLHGNYVEQDYARAVPLLEQAADDGLLEALFDLAVCFEQGLGVERNARKAFEHYLRAALGGDSDAVHEVGRCYYYGIGVPEDKILARIWLDHAEEEDSDPAEEENV